MRSFGLRRHVVLYMVINISEQIISICFHTEERRNTFLRNVGDKL
jgi:hypothetical protein